jgi:hypothetical protein
MLHQFLELSARAAKEQEEYRQAVVAEIMTCKSAYFYIHPDIERQILVSPLSHTLRQ